MKAVNRLLLFVGFCLLVFLAVWPAQFLEKIAETTSPDAKAGGEPISSLRICSQNLFRFGEIKRRRKPAKQKQYLVKRMKKARCDIIALQEVIGESRSEALSIIAPLAESLQKATKREFAAYAAEENAGNMRNGFLVAADIGRVQSVASWHRQALPRLQVLGPPRRWHRGPLALHIALAGAKGPQDLLVVSMHLKSKYEHWKDPSGTSYEIERMESAEALRELSLKKAQELGPKTTLIVLGDRNSQIFSASAHILEGQRLLGDFRSNSHCSLTTELSPDCGGREKEPRRLLGLFAHQKRLCKGKCNIASYRYRRKGELIDEVYLRPKELHLVQKDDKSLRIGLEGQFFKGSDHLLLWAELDLR